MATFQYQSSACLTAHSLVRRLFPEGLLSAQLFPQRDREASGNRNAAAALPERFALHRKLHRSSPAMFRCDKLRAVPT